MSKCDMENTLDKNYFSSVLLYLERQGVTCGDAVAPTRGAEFEQVNRVGLAEYEQVLQFGAQQTCDPLFGFHLGQQIQSADYGVLGYLVENCENLNQALMALLHYDQLVASIGQAKFHHQGDWAVLDWLPNLQTTRHVILRNMTGWVAMVRALLTQPVAPEHVSLTCSLNANEASQLAHWFGCPVVGSQPHNQIKFPRAYLSLPFRRANSAMHEALQRLSDKALVQLQQHHTLATQIRIMLAASADLGQCQLDAVAGVLNKSVRQVQRQLKQCHTSYSQLLTEERMRRAENLLGTLPLAELARELGFNEQAAFNKAFKRWFGVSPGKYHKRS
ncbi:helix-turn-helix domain-containing protein [Pseudoalteromonas viridis]|uniref:AraC family transcriptional regulator ligand-binding domain-containing protein n=1 Tax=Pseudoalteromonas viridis TaxID=339617 RepID=A0ABX7V8V5_9GAMM|nr:AraC family transcriptional regulator [Pseudoalteromonas viridis]QTL35630.1 AraC family transcriptional regulator ligand-binding domain-containing protein [Pseudoalteromonas viridis]